MTKIDEMIHYFRQGENYLLESRTEMAEHTDNEREYFYNRGLRFKEKGSKLFKWLVNNIGIDEEYLGELLRNEDI